MCVVCTSCISFSLYASCHSQSKIFKCTTPTCKVKVASAADRFSTALRFVVHFYVSSLMNDRWSVLLHDQITGSNHRLIKQGAGEEFIYSGAVITNYTALLAPSWCSVIRDQYSSAAFSGWHRSCSFPLYGHACERKNLVLNLLFREITKRVI